MNTTTCYQKLVEAVIEEAHREVSFEFDNFPGFAARGHSEKRISRLGKMHSLGMG